MTAVSFPHVGFNTPYGVCISPDRKFALVANMSGGNVGRIDLVTNELTFPFKAIFHRPLDVAISPDGTFALVANYYGLDVGRIDLLTLEVTIPYSGFNRPMGLSISPDGRFALVANWSGNSVGKIDLATHRVTYPYLGFKEPSGVAHSPDGTFALVANSGAANVGRIDLLTHKVTFSYDLFVDGAVGITIAPDGTFALVATRSGMVGRIDLLTHEVSFPYVGFATPHGLSISPDGMFALVANTGNNSVGRISMVNQTVWLKQWRDGFTHPIQRGTGFTCHHPRSPSALPSHEDVRQMPTAIPPHMGVPCISVGVMKAARARKSAACMAPACTPRVFGLFQWRYVCTMCASTVCSGCVAASGSEWGGLGGALRCVDCQRLVHAPRWSDAAAGTFEAAVKVEADCIPLVVRTLAGDRHVVAGGSGWATAVDLVRFVVKAIGPLQQMGAVEQFSLLNGATPVDPNFYTSEARALMVCGTLAPEVIIFVGGSGVQSRSDDFGGGGSSRCGGGGSTSTDCGSGGGGGGGSGGDITCTK
jgi:DNA-binding beta-propeller fold protein YncE/uncharacterized membrane protein YgcG